MKRSKIFKNTYPSINNCPYFNGFKGIYVKV